MNKSDDELAVARSVYAQMCHFTEETEHHSVGAAKTTQRTANFVKIISGILAVFVIVIGFYIISLSNQFVQIVDHMTAMNTKVLQVSQRMASMTENVGEMNGNVAHMSSVVSNMQSLNGSVQNMQTKMGGMSSNMIYLNGLGGRALNTFGQMNGRMTQIDQSTENMGVRLYDIAKPMKYFPNR